MTGLVWIALIGGLTVMVTPVRFRFGAALAVAAAAFTFIPAKAFDIGAASSVAGSALGALFIALALLTSLRKLRLDARLACVVAITALGEVGGALSPEPNLFAMVVAGVAPLVFVTARGASRGERRMTLWALVMLGLVEALLCAYEALVRDVPFFAEVPYGENPFIDGAIRGQGTLGHPLVAALVLIVSMVAITDVAKSRSVIALGIVVLAVGVIATGSSSAIVAAVFYLAARWVFRGRALSRVAKIVVGLGLAVVATATPVLTGALSADIGGNNSVHRLNSVYALPRLLTDRSFREAVFGSGWGSAENLYQRNVLINDNFYAIDNQFTTILATAGIVGLLLFLCLVAVVFRTDPTARLAIATFAVMGLSFDVLSWVATGAAFWIFLGFGTGAGSERDDGIEQNCAAHQQSPRETVTALTTWTTRRNTDG
ncbi:O-antigen ligase [Curtobacterium sp. MWU13-2055]|uniref:O-antigen ligase family protein n=1 Tax=Curtobacterium sp. MWU13-2055 TaxID=2931928 RepID=UPI00200F2B8D|nr:O-antigen ligase family protein [Curtobacterium sp. MWU13-2055]